jgi:hypothetical protein
MTNSLPLNTSTASTQFITTNSDTIYYPGLTHPCYISLSDKVYLSAPAPRMWPSWFGGGRKDHKETARDSIVNLRGQLLMLEKREDYIQKQIDEEMRKARANATTNKRCE